MCILGTSTGSYVAIGRVAVAHNQRAHLSSTPRTDSYPVTQAFRCVAAQNVRHPGVILQNFELETSSSQKLFWNRAPLQWSTEFQTKEESRETPRNSCIIACHPAHANWALYTMEMNYLSSSLPKETQFVPKGFCLAILFVPPMISCPLASRSHGSGTKSSSPWCLAATATGKMTSMSLPMRCGSTTCL